MRKRFTSSPISRVRYRYKGPVIMHHQEGVDDDSKFYTWEEVTERVKSSNAKFIASLSVSKDSSAFLYIPSLPGPLLTQRDIYHSSPEPVEPIDWTLSIVIGLAGLINLGVFLHGFPHLLWFNLLGGIVATMFGGFTTGLFLLRVHNSAKNAPLVLRELDYSSDLIQRLGNLYEEIYKYTLQDNDSVAKGALIAAHMALIEVNDLLGSNSPQTPEEIAYVQDRVEALDKVQLTLSSRAERQLLQASEEKQKAIDAESLIRKESIQALVAFDDRTQIGSLSRLNTIANSPLEPSPNPPNS